MRTIYRSTVVGYFLIVFLYAAVPYAADTCEQAGLTILVSGNLDGRIEGRKG
jgi:hypothetical protein